MGWIDSKEVDRSFSNKDREWIDSELFIEVDWCVISNKEKV